MEFLNKFDRQKLQRITLIVIAALTLIALVLLLVIIIGSVEGGSRPDDIDDPAFDNIDKFNTETVNVTSAQLGKGSLLVVNKSNKYDIPADLNLVSIYEYRAEHRGNAESTYNLPDSSQKLEVNAMMHAHNMLMALGDATKNHNIMISSAFRTHAEQAALNNDTQAGYSDSHTGQLIALKVMGSATPYLPDESNADLYNWLLNNAHKYGYVVRYPSDKADKTYVSEYTYAFRYVGVAHATYMKENNLCLEEYVELLKSNHNGVDNRLRIVGADGSAYVVYYTAVSADGGNVKVPIQTPNPDGSTSYPYTISGTNEGGVVVTVKLN